MQNAAIQAEKPQKFTTFSDFYPFYLSEHSNVMCRRLHFIGSSLALISLVMAVVMLNPWWILVGVLQGYGFAWIGHFGFEKNKPASFKQPFYSFMGDWVMYLQIWRGKVKI
jgi:hypothetical protein